MQAGGLWCTTSHGDMPYCAWPFLTFRIATASSITTSACSRKNIRSLPGGAARAIAENSQWRASGPSTGSLALRARRRLLNSFSSIFCICMRSSLATFKCGEASCEEGNAVDRHIFRMLVLVMNGCVRMLRLIFYIKYKCPASFYGHEIIKKNT